MLAFGIKFISKNESINPYKNKFTKRWWNFFLALTYFPLFVKNHVHNWIFLIEKLHLSTHVILLGVMNVLIKRGKLAQTQKFSTIVLFTFYYFFIYSFFIWCIYRKLALVIFYNISRVCKNVFVRWALLKSQSIVKNPNFVKLCLYHACTVGN